MLKAINGPTDDDFGPVSVVGQTWHVEWVPINDPEAIVDLHGAARALRREAPSSGGSRAAGGATSRATSCPPTADRSREGQVFEYDPINETHQAHLRLDDRQRSATTPTTSR